jgi:hypothetical protein
VPKCWHDAVRAKPLTSSSKADGRFGKQDFVYLAGEDTYHCLAGGRVTSWYASVEDLACLLDLDLPELRTQSQVHDR